MNCTQRPRTIRTPKKVKWAIGFDFCQVCESDQRKHQKGGLCRKCYDDIRREILRKPRMITGISGGQKNKFGTKVKVDMGDYGILKGFSNLVIKRVDGEKCVQVKCAVSRNRLWLPKRFVKVVSND